jgi:Zn ribbon nucleic-acid-binding protein
MDIVWPMKVTMVKKRLSDGSECRKCSEASVFLKEKGVWDMIDTIVWYEENNAQSDGGLLAAKHKMERAPFFIIERPGRDAEVIDSVMRAYRML